MSQGRMIITLTVDLDVQQSWEDKAHLIIASMISPGISLGI